MRIAIIGLGLALIFEEKMPRARQEEIRVGCNRELAESDLTVNGVMEKHPAQNHVNNCFLAFIFGFNNFILEGNKKEYGNTSIEL